MDIFLIPIGVALISLAIAIFKLWLELKSSKKNEQLLKDQTEATIKLYTALEEIANGSEKTIDTLEVKIDKCQKDISALKRKISKSQKSMTSDKEKKRALEIEKLEQRRRETERKERAAKMRAAKDIAKAIGLLK